jgi:hypothetical protein
MADQHISAGTQVVSRVEVRGTNSALVHPRGAVGVVTRTPAVAGEKFRVRFSERSQFSLQRDQLELLKHFNARLSVAVDVSRLTSKSAIAGHRSRLTLAATPTGDFDHETFITCRCVVGSRAYGLDQDDSDTDWRGGCLAPADLPWSLFGAPGDSFPPPLCWSRKHWRKRSKERSPALAPAGQRLV